MKRLKTLAQFWVYCKRAFSVSGSFRKALTDLITNLHNSNKPIVQTRITLFDSESTFLDDEIIPKEKFFLLGFVRGKDIKIEKDTGYTILNSEQLSLLTDCLNKKSYF